MCWWHDGNPTIPTHFFLHNTLAPPSWSVDLRSGNKQNSCQNCLQESHLDENSISFIQSLLRSHKLFKEKIWSWPTLKSPFTSESLTEVVKSGHCLFSLLAGSLWNIINAGRKTAGQEDFILKTSSRLTNALPISVSIFYWSIEANLNEVCFPGSAVCEQAKMCNQFSASSSVDIINPTNISSGFGLSCQCVQDVNSAIL